MRPAVLVGGAGVWLLCQVFRGNALGRLGLIGSAADAAEADAAAANVASSSATSSA